MVVFGSLRGLQSDDTWSHLKAQLSWMSMMASLVTCLAHQLECLKELGDFQEFLSPHSPFM